MSEQNLFLAVYLGRKDSPQMKAWEALSEEEQQARGRKGVAEWKAWVERHQPAIVDIGGPLGKTTTIGAHGIEATANAMSGYTIVRSASQEEAAKMFENHPHFTIFPGESVEVMPVLPIPGG
ncbi:hypothetical protein [Paraburkholderia sp. J12]|uniref:hypothetical protein n=1 Tax=Paraburkholderia sp. J12 TaxID=2805432 RepID=UPI002ABD6999|nr:hypothetical protein [Paraburkholderia sp. J12]